MGSRISVSAVAVIRPPMTTMAKRPLDLGARPAGKQQRDQAESRDRRGHQHRAQPPLGALGHAVQQRQAFGMQLVEVAHQHHAVEHRDAQQRDEAHRGRHRQVLARGPQRDDAADQCERDVAQHQQAWRTEPKVENRMMKMKPSDAGTTRPTAPRRAAGSRTGRPRPPGSRWVA
jgi:hypothetical protein